MIRSGMTAVCESSKIVSHPDRVSNVDRPMIDRGTFDALLIDPYRTRTVERQVWSQRDTRCVITRKAFLTRERERKTPSMLSHINMMLSSSRLLRSSIHARGRVSTHIVNHHLGDRIFSPRLVFLIDRFHVFLPERLVIP